MSEINQQLEQDGFLVLPAVIPGARVRELAAAIDALGGRHGLRNLLRDSPVVSALARELSPLVARILGPDAFCVRGLFFDKLPDANWEVSWHQDLSIAVAERRDLPGFAAWSAKQGVMHVQPPAAVLEGMLTVRLHLDDCPADNGPLRVIRSSHRQGRLTDDQIAHWKRAGEQVACLANAGDALLMRPLLLHASSPANKPHHRRVLHLEYAADALPEPLQWFEQANAAS